MCCAKRRAGSGRVEGAGFQIVGGPIPHPPDAVAGTTGSRLLSRRMTWQVGLYLFVGGAGGMAASLRSLLS